ncbi:MAG: N,N-dimethylformamidase beta subunit family domain-containing protein, partial [Methylococcales bacterium]
MKKQNKKYHNLTVFVFTILTLLFIEQTAGWALNIGVANANQVLRASSESHDLFVFSPNGDVLANADQNGLISVWDVASGQMRLTLPSEVTSPVTDLVFSSNGNELASISNNSIKLWDLVSGNNRLILPQSSDFSNVVFSPDGKFIAAVDRNQHLSLWDSQSGTVNRVLVNYQGSVSSIAFSPDSTTLAISDKDAKVMFWNLKTGLERSSIEKQGNVAFANLVFSPNGEILVAVGEDASVRLLDLLSGSTIRVLAANQNNGKVNTIAFSQDASLLAIGGQAQIKLWSLKTGLEQVSLSRNKGAIISDLVFSQDGGTLSSVDNSGQVVIWNLMTGQGRQVSLSGDALPGSLAPLSGNAALQAKASSMPGLAQNMPISRVSSQVAVNDKLGKVKTARSSQNWKGIRGLALSQDGLEMGTSGEDGTIRVFNKNGTQKWKVSGHHGRAITGLAFRGKSKESVSVGVDTEIKIWDGVGKNLKTFYGPEHPIRTVAVSPDGRIIATAGEDTRIFLYDAGAGKLSAIFSGHVDFVNGLAFSPDGKTLASAGSEGRTLLWDAVTGKQRGKLLGHSGAVNAVAFSPDGARLATASVDNTVILWDVITGKQIKVLAGHQNSVKTVAFSPNGKKLVSSGEDGRVLVWDAKTGLLKNQQTGSSVVVNALAFDPEGNLHAAGENNEVSEFNVETDTKMDTLVIPVPTVIEPQVSRSEPLNLAGLNAGIVTPSHFILNSSADLVTLSRDTLMAGLYQLLDWVIPAANAALPDPNQGPGGSILVIKSGTPGFGDYYAEILRTEGFNEFAVADISTVTSATLSSYDVVILSQIPLTPSQVTMLNTWVTGGGNLIAMRPDKQLASLLGLTDAGSMLDNGYMLVNTVGSPGKGIVGETMQFHGTADRYTLSGGGANLATVATLYNDATTSTVNPAVTLRSNIGTLGGQAAAFTYDLAKSIIYTRQGNPAWATQDRDITIPNMVPLIRSDDKFYGDGPNDSQPDWIDFSKISIPQGDEQQRLLANLILEMNEDKKPLPRFWYLPLGFKAAVIMTGDDHANNGTQGRFDYFIAHSPAGCSVRDWQCVRGTSYMFYNTPLTNTSATSYNAQGFEVGLHVNTNCANYTPATLENFYVSQIAAFTTNFSGVPAPVTQRHHCIAWSDWVTGAKVQLNHGIRFDTSYYFWPPSWVLDRPGFFSGSGMPMRFADLDGSLIDVYNASSQMTDESGQSYPYTIDTLLDKALGAEGYYGAFTINAHTDLATQLESEATVASAQTRNVPIITSRQMMDWLDHRNSSSFGGVTWSGNTLNFTVTPGNGGVNVPSDGLQVLLPMQSAGGVLTTLKRNNVTVPYMSSVIKGVAYVVFSGVAGSYSATYAVDTTAPFITAKTPAAGAAGVSLSTVITATFSEPVDASTINGSTFELRNSSNVLVPSTVSYNPGNLTTTLTPSSLLGSSATYTVTVKGGTTDPRVKDLAGNALSSNVSWTFTTLSLPCYSTACSAWSSGTVPGTPSVNDPVSVELGVKFKSDINGWVTGVRFYQVNAGAGAGRTFPASLWSLSGQQLATGSVTSTASGWQQVNFSTPVAISSNTVYVASYHAPNGNYAANGPSFAAAGIDNPPIHLLKDGVSGLNGLYTYSAGSTFPTSSFSSANYWVDVMFSTNVVDAFAPTVISTTPAAGVTGVNPAGSVKVIFSEAMSAATISPANFELRSSLNNVLVLASVAYDAATNTATLTPNSSLAASTDYTAKVVGGTSGVKDVAGNPLLVDKVWAFKTGIDPCLNGANPIICENSKTGNPAIEWDINGAGDPSIQGFATDISVNKGQTVRFKINTPSTNYRLDIYRMGYYDGNGARKVATVEPSAVLPQNQQPCLSHAPTGLVDCGNWTESASWLVPVNATSGIYFAKVIREDGGNTGASHIVFIVRDDVSTSEILFQTADTTWQAYNTSGGNIAVNNSFYGGTGPGTGSGSGRAYKVSYNRPFNTRSVDNGQDWVFNAEYPMVRWLEANGYDVSYFTGVDSDRFGSLIKNHKLFLSNAHDEYWSDQQRSNVEAARDALVNPVSLAFFSGNEVYWKTRWENNITGANGTLGADSYRTLVCYKETHNFPNNPDPTNIWTGTWRDPRGTPPADGGRPENALKGNIFTVNDGATTSILVPEADGKMRFWRNTLIANLASGASATLPSGTLGYEWNEDLDNGFRPAGLVRLSTTIVPNAPVLTDYGSTFGSGTANHALTLYKAASGARVFGAGTVQWAWGLDGHHDRTVVPTDTSMQQATVNLFADMGIQPGGLQPGLTPAVASTDVTRPISAITTPSAGASVPAGSLVTIVGTATDAVGGLVGGIEVSVDGGVTWHTATGRANWTYAWTTPATTGSVNIKSRAVDDSLNLEIPGAGRAVNIVASDPTPPSLPTGLAATAAGTSQINLAWTASTDNVAVTGY